MPLRALCMARYAVKIRKSHLDDKHIGLAEAYIVYSKALLENGKIRAACMYIENADRILKGFRLKHPLIKESQKVKALLSLKKEF